MDSALHHVEDFLSVFKDQFIVFALLEGLAVDFAGDGVFSEDEHFFGDVDLAEFVSEVHEDIVFFAFDSLSVVLPDFFHGFGVSDAYNHHLVFDLLADSASKFFGDSRGARFAVEVVGDVGDSERTSQSQVKFDVHN